MRKKTIIGVVLILCVAIIGIILVLKLKDSRDYIISDGKYYIKNNEEFKDAYIEVKGDYIRFYNIDLNAVYSEKLKQDYDKLVSKNNDLELSDEEYKKAVDFNSLLIEKSYKMDYEGSKENKLGTSVYYYFIYNDDSFLSLALHYDTVDKTLTLYRGSDCKLEFEKK